MTPRITVVGLGPGNPAHVTAETLAAIEATPTRFLRTARHPSASLVPGAVSFDDVYEAADTFADVYAEIAERLVAAASDPHGGGHVLYAVPGSPLVLERTVATLRADDRVEVTVLPAVSFLDVTWARLGIDPLEAGVRLVDGHEFATAAAGVTGAVLVAHTHANWVLSDIKLAIDDPTGAIDETPVVLLQALGTDGEQIVHTTWGEMDRALPGGADHLTSLFIPDLGVPVAEGYARFHQLARTLRERCPWDVEQTHQSLVPYLIEETYEVVDAIAALGDDGDGDEHLIEELGDLLYQIEFHATIAEQEGRFTIADVTRGVRDKLVRRHPHVFGSVEATDADTVLTNWDAIKRQEKAGAGRQRTSIFDGVPGSLPALSYADKVQRKAAKVGFDWADVDGAVPKIAEETDELLAAEGPAVAEEAGDLLFAVVNVLRHLRVDPESALRAATNKFRARFEQVEALARERGIDLHASDLATLDALWDEVKRG